VAQADPATEERPGDSRPQGDDGSGTSASFATARSRGRTLGGRRKNDLYATYGGNKFYGQTFVYGDVVGQDKEMRWSATGGPSDQPSDGVLTARVDQARLRKVRFVYLTPKPYEEARRRLDQHHLAILFGRPGCGKFASALNLLSHSETDRIDEVEPAVEVTHLLRFHFEDDRRYVVDGLCLDSARRLNPVLVSRLSERLQEKNTYLVLTVNRGPGVQLDGLDRFVVGWLDVPDREGLLRRHLEWQLDGSDLAADLERVIDAQEVRQLISMERTPGEIDRFAAVLQLAVRGELSVADAVARFELEAEREVAAWLQAHHNLPDYSFLLAASVLDGLSYPAVADAAGRLESCLSALRRMPEEPSIVSLVLANSRARRLEEVGARLVPGLESTDYGEVEVERLVLNNPIWRFAVLRHVWDEHDLARNAVVRWFQELGDHHNVNVRDQVAAVVGKLSEHDFDHLLGKVLTRWAASDSLDMRMSAAWSLCIAASNDAITPRVRSLLQNWIEDGNDGLKWTAAATYGYIGRRFPDVAIEGLEAILLEDDDNLLDGVAVGFYVLFDAGHHADQAYGRILGPLDRWTNREKLDAEWERERIVKSQRRWKATAIISLRLFLVICEANDFDDDASNIKWPGVLWAMESDSEAREQGLTLWRRALNEQSTRDKALEVLHDWVLRADDEDGLFDPLLRLVTELTDDGAGRGGDRLRHHLKRWTNTSRVRSRTVDRLLSALNEEAVI
jgi:hypothetical protein